MDLYMVFRGPEHQPIADTHIRPGHDRLAVAAHAARGAAIAAPGIEHVVERIRDGSTLSTRELLDGHGEVCARYTFDPRRKKLAAWVA